MLDKPLHKAGADGLCKECGEPFPCSTGLAIYGSVVEPNVASDQIHLVLTRDELTTIATVLRASCFFSLAERVEAVAQVS